MVVNDSRCGLKMRRLAARLLRDIQGNATAFIPSPPSRSDSPQVRHPAPRSTGQHRHAIPAILGRQRHRAFSHRVRPALIEVLEDTSAPANVRGWAAERRAMHISQATVQACLRATEDSTPEVRIWSVCTLGRRRRRRESHAGGDSSDLKRSSSLGRRGALRRVQRSFIP